uniref:Uncharacterized protein n=1 Tax=Arion vulgaris TaxID=1028688 RepID=A0A0B7B5U5_9EUPU
MPIFFFDEQQMRGELVNITLTSFTSQLFSGNQLKLDPPVSNYRKKTSFTPTVELI